MAQLTDRMRGPGQSGRIADCFSVICSMAGIAALLLGTTATAQPYPQKPIRVIVPFSPGGGSDVVARLVGPKLSARLGQPVVIVNQPAASGVVGTDTAAKAQPDGHTLLLITSTHAVNARLATALTDGGGHANCVGGRRSVREIQAPATTLDLGWPPLCTTGTRFPWRPHAQSVAHVRRTSRRHRMHCA